MLNDDLYCQTIIISWKSQFQGKIVQAITMLFIRNQILFLQKIDWRIIFICLHPSYTH